MRNPRWLLLLTCLGCDPRAEASDLVGQASAQANQLGRDVKTATRAQVDKGVSAAKAAVFGLSDSGALSEAGVTWLKKQNPSDAAIESWVAKGSQVAPVAVEIAKVANQAVDEETAIEPIYQPIEPGTEGTLDASIAKMPRVEVIDGVTVGFKKLDAIENATISKEQAVLVVWRRGDHLVGFLYRSKRTIDLNVVVREAPRLIALTHGVLK